MRVLFAGLPATGKSTFLYAFYHLLESGEVAGSLRIKSLGENRAYINKKAEAWLSFDETERTNSENETEIEITLAAGDEDIGLQIPDLAGEHFERCLSERQWTKQLGDGIRSCHGILLFVHPNELKKAINIDHTNEKTTGLIDVDELEQNVPFEYEKAPTQVLLVDLLQLFHYARDGEPFKVALIISAYDLIANSIPKPIDISEGLSPAAWLEKEMPMLAHYLNGTFANEDIKIYGVSAQGGDLKDKQEKKRLMNTMDASERVWILEDERKHADLSAPIRWLVDLED